jgi:hypothetical protein
VNLKLPKYCYWSVATGSYGSLMENCVRTARQAGVFKEFHVVTDRPLEGCECYDAMQCDKADGMFKLHYLKAGMSRLLFDYFVWLDADTVFVRNPVDVLAPLSGSPIHVPLELNLSTVDEDRQWREVSCFKLRELFVQMGVANQVYLSRSAFWIVHREAIDQVFELAFRFFHAVKGAGLAASVDTALGYAMQILCADPEAHLLTRHSDLWASSDSTCFGASKIPNAQLSSSCHPLTEQAILVKPAIVHKPIH